jgi:uncharacterized protein (TIGR03435 family)
MRLFPGTTALLVLTQTALAPAAPAPKFAVASIKPAASKLGVPMNRSTPDGGITLTNVTVGKLIVNAWHMLPYQIVGAPSWTASARYDISAKPDKPVKPTEVGLMLQSLLADRFGLALRRETRNLPIYALVVTRKDGRLGPSLVQSKDGGCTIRNPSDLPPGPEAGKPSARWCGLLMMFPKRLNGAAVPLVALAEQFSLRLGRTVVDMTGLKGSYDINLGWTSDEGQLPISDAPPDSRPLSDPQGPTIFTALSEQLGLKLESRKGPVEVLVIDHVEGPSAN